MVLWFPFHSPPQKKQCHVCDAFLFLNVERPQVSRNHLGKKNTTNTLAISNFDMRNRWKNTLSTCLRRIDSIVDLWFCHQCLANSLFFFLSLSHSLGLESRYEWDTFVGFQGCKEYLDNNFSHFSLKKPVVFHQEAELLRYRRAMEARCDAIIQEGLHSSTNDLEW